MRRLIIGGERDAQIAPGSLITQVGAKDVFQGIGQSVPVRVGQWSGKSRIIKFSRREKT